MTLAALTLTLALASSPWDAPFAPPEPSIAAARALPPPADGVLIDLVLEETIVDFDEENRASVQSRLVSLLRTPSAVREWGTVAFRYSPWHQERPEITVRVLSPAGQVTWLDPATLVETTPDGEAQGPIFTDRRELRGPIPGLEPGALLEERMVLRDRLPYFEPGSAPTFWAGRSLPVRRRVIRVSAPAGRPLRFKAHGLPPPAEATEGGRRVLRWDLSPLPPAEPQEDDAAPEQAGRRVAVSTARSWREVAAAYHALVERQLAGADLAGAAGAVVQPGDGPARAAQRVLDFVAARVRYAGLSLGERSLVPAPPAETLARGFGDCKDMATLAVGLLRAAGHDAAVALITSGGAEPDPELPGLAFDHAIVRVGGREPLWFDPTDPATPAGALPPWLQGRLALPAHPGADRLVRTPEARPEENGWVKVRRIRLAEEGWAAASEESTFRGASAADVRRWLEVTTPADRDRAACQRLNCPADATGTSRVEAEATGPVRSTLAAPLSRWAHTEEAAAEAILAPHQVFQRLPGSFRTEVLEPGAADAAPPPRRGPMLLPEAFAAELRYEVVPPPGYRPGQLPEAVDEAMGPARLSGSFEAGADGAVRATWRFTVPRRSLTAAEADALWKAVAARTRRDEPRARFQRTWNVLLAEGKGREALDEIGRLEALHPAEALHPMERAAALLHLGLGEAARAAARRAVALEPGAEAPHRALANALSHDLLGRQYGASADLPGALAEARRAVELAPRSPAARGLLARLLEQGRFERYGHGARLDEALALRQALQAEQPGGEAGGELAMLLFMMGRHREARTAALAAMATPDRNAILLAAAAAADGLDAFREASAAIPEADRVAAATGATRWLLAGRQYRVMAELSERGAATVPPDQREQALTFVRALRQAGSGPVDPRDPAALANRLVRAVFGGAPEQEALALVAREAADRDAVARELVRGFSAAGFAGPSRAALAELIPGIGELEVRGDGPPWFLIWKFPSAPRVTLIAVREEGEVRVAACNARASGFGAFALRAARAGDLAVARRLLAWALEAKDSGGATRRIWRHGEAADQAELELAAYALAGPFGLADAAMAARLRAAAEAASGDDRLLLLLAASDAALVAGRFEDVRALADAFDALDLGRVGRDYRTRALLTARRFGEARASAEAWLRDRPGDLDPLRHLVTATAWLGDLEAEAAASRQVLAHEYAVPGDFNNAAWFELSRPHPAPEALAWARKGAGEKKPDAASLHTLATVQAWCGRPAEAMTTLRHLAAVRGDRLDPEDWIVVGRIAEAYGLRAEAAEAYRRVQPPAHANGFSAHAVAQRWLAGLEAPTGAPGAPPPR